MGQPCPRNGEGRHDAVTFASSNPRVVSVSADGALRALAAGRATITAKAGPATATQAIQVVPNSVTKLAVEPASAAVRTGDVVHLAADAKDAAGRVVKDVAIEWALRSEERRVGKECRSRWAREHEKERRM